MTYGPYDIVRSESISLQPVGPSRTNAGISILNIIIIDTADTSPIRLSRTTQSTLFPPQV